MGLEWYLGCLKCKQHIWLGSQKISKWSGFQIGDENVRIFFALHSQCDNQENGNFLLVNEYTTGIPWRDKVEMLEWKEDLLSRSFCWDSKFEGGLKCANCLKKLNETEEGRMLNSNLKKGQYLWFCHDLCFNSYLKGKTDWLNYLIYDSTDEQTSQMAKGTIELGCTCCKNYVVIDNQKDAVGNTKNFEFLAEFLSEHIGHDHLLKVNIGEEYEL